MLKVSADTLEHRSFPAHRCCQLIFKSEMEPEPFFLPEQHLCNQQQIQSKNMLQLRTDGFVSQASPTSIGFR
ncbi:hypothetical protein PAPYR_11870 [Paratrimastix pyriformis]|uniref:Uncharacterized protein n=1 Tax=Paratrimastix pyriformis TaxID=342808 RepID=A0ABQ8U6M3_9EUKA|nr:hypothetical protein PAPYR_11870 [Paratrimastix pyriformis]